MAIYKRGRGFELGTTENKSSKWPERDANPGPPDSEYDALTTRPRCLMGLVVRRPISANPDLNSKPDFFFFFSNNFPPSL